LTFLIQQRKKEDEVRELRSGTCNPSLKIKRGGETGYYANQKERQVKGRSLKRGKMVKKRKRER